MELTEKQQYELLAAISARGEIPTKFTYLDGGETFWDKVYNERAQDGAMANAELELLLTHVQSFLNVFKDHKSVNLVDLGCGNGQPAIPIIKQLHANGFDVMYLAVDISANMLELAESNVRKELSDLQIKKLLIDFEKESITNELLNLKQQRRSPNLLINLGNTLGNYVNTSSVLTNFLESMTLDDYLLLGNGLANDYNPQKILTSYTDAVCEMVTRPAKLLGLFGPEDQFNFVWNSSKTRVEARIKLNAPKQITLAQQEIRLDKDEELLVMVSDKYSEASLTKLLSDGGFRTELLTTTKNRDEILTLVQPTRYSTS